MSQIDNTIIAWLELLFINLYSFDFIDLSVFINKNHYWLLIILNNITQMIDNVCPSTCLKIHKNNDQMVVK